MTTEEMIAALKAHTAEIHPDKYGMDFCAKVDRALIQLIHEGKVVFDPVTKNLYLTSKFPKH